VKARCRGKSGLHGDTVPDNVRRGRPQGKRHRNDTAYRPKAAARLKWCGKSAPHSWQQEWLGKPHREQDQIGAARNPFPDSRPGRSREVCGNTHPRGIAIHRGQPRGQNPAYRPSDALIALSAFTLGVLYGGAPHVPHLLLALLCAVVGTITGRRLGQVYPLRRMLGRLG